ncbi:MAG: DUF1836 domain-containing protein [Oscillospiraceae bacterium]|nr:DUF1836 domain-containing protein [Oscillospiraceae bacterium]MCL2278105.1 DUF1836 domain-containing protein [Oscillospiraceae bacterium]
MLNLSTDTLRGPSKTSSDQGLKGFDKIQMLLEATGGLSLSQVCSVTGLEGSTIQNWVKRGWVKHPVGKKYEEVHIARILIINALKECIKLEHISMLMSYVNGKSQDGSEAIIKESTLYNYLYEALKQSGQASDHSRGGVEAVIENVIKEYKDPNPNSKIRIRKALTLMMFACVCTDVKRRTEAMMGQILSELEEPKHVSALPKLDLDLDVRAVVPQVPAPVPTPTPAPVSAPLELVAQEEEPPVVEVRKTVSQALHELREWDTSSVEKIIIDYEEDVRDAEQEREEKAKPQSKPWYVRKGPK